MRYPVAAVVAALVMATATGWADEPDTSTEGEESAAETADERLSAPELIHEEQAEYTDEAVDERIEGGVVLELEINSEGSVVGVEVVEGLGYGLDEAAVEAAEQFEFIPARVDGEPIPVIIDFTVHFSLPTIPAKFTGTVVDAQRDEGVGDARIFIEYVGDEHHPPPRAHTRTDGDGTFSFEEVPPGAYRVEGTVPTHHDFDTDIELADGDHLDVEYSVAALDENVAGRIREAGTRSPLPGMELVLVDVDTGEVVREGYSEAEGFFGFRGVEPGYYWLDVTGSGYEPESFEIEVVADEVTSGNFYIRAENYDDLTVRTTERRERSEVNRQTIELEETRRMAGAGTDAVRVVENLPGVARQSYVAGQPVVRGAAPQDTQIFLEGDAVPLAFHFLGGPAVVNTEMIQAVDFYPGNFSARFGRATAGIIDMQTRSPRDDRLHGSVEADFLDTSAMVEGPINDRFSFAFSARRSYIDAFLNPILSEADLDAFVAPRYYDYQGWGTYRSEDGAHKVEAFVYGSDDRLELIFADEPQGDANIQATGLDFGTYFHRAQLRWEYDDEASPFESELMASFGRSTFGFNLAENLYFELDDYSTRLRWDTSMELSDRLELNSGIDSQIGPVVYDYAIPEFDTGPDDGVPALDAFGSEDSRSTWLVQPAAYAELDFEAIDDWTITPGLRVDYFGTVGRTSVSPRLSSRFDVTDEFTAKGGVGLFTQPPLPGQTEEEFGNPDLTFEKAMHYALGAEWQPDDHLEVDTTLFFRDNRDLVNDTAAEELDDDGNRRPLVYDNEGRGRAYGWELMLRHYPQNNFFGWIAYTLSRSERLDPSTDDWELFETDQTHILTLVAGYELPWNFDISGRFRLVSGEPQTPIAGAAFDADADTYRPIRGETHSTRSSPFHQLDLRIDREFIFNTWRLSAYLDITNVYNATNAEGTQYNYDYTESEPVRGVPFLPTLGVTARF